MSFLRTVDPERCEWVRQPLPSGEAVTVFSFNGACDRSMVSWSPDGKQGLVFTWPSGEGEVPKAWRVDLVAHKGQPLDLKTLPLEEPALPPGPVPGVRPRALAPK